jgi:hypothetical protein
MSLPGDAIDNADLKAIAAGGLVNEDVLQKIFQLSEVQTPFQDMIGTDECNADYTSWVQDELGNPSTSNVRVSGSDPTTFETATGARVGNRTQINARTPIVSERAQNSDVIGTGDELTYQEMLAIQRVRQDVEAHVTSNQASVEDDGSSTAGKAGGFPAWIASNDQLAVGGSSGGFNTSTKNVDAPTPGAARVLSWADVDTVVLNVYNSFGNITAVMTTPTLVQQINKFLKSSGAAGIRANPVANIDGSGGKVEQTAQGFYNVIVTDFGTTLTIVPNRLMQTHKDGVTAAHQQDVVDVLFVDPARAAMAYLDGYKTKQLGKTGLSDKRDVTVDWTLKVYNEKAHGVIRDILPGGTVTA